MNSGQRLRPCLEILEDRLAPAFNLSIADPPPFPEGDSGTTNMIFTVTRTGEMAPCVRVNFTTQDGTAIGGTDYTATSGTLNFAVNQTTATISIPIIGNTLPQPDRSFTVNLSYPVDGAAFGAHEMFAADRNPFSVAVGDFNGDGRPDLAVANDGSDTVSVLLNTTVSGAATPTFAAQKPFNVGANPESVAVADFNGDGRLDLAVTNALSHISATLSVLLNTTTLGAPIASFAPQQTFGTGSVPRSVAVGDINGDGRPDLAVANSDVGENSVSVLLNTTPLGATTASFGTHQTFSTGTSPWSVAMGDINGDGRPDLAAANVHSHNVSVLLNTTPVGATMPNFAAQQTFATGLNPISVAVRDVNGDGRTDLAVANDSSNTVSVLLNTTAPGAATANFAAQQTFATGNTPISVALGDLNGDGRPDLAVANRDCYTLSVLLNTTATGESTATFAAHQMFGTGLNPRSVAVGDFNTDGRPDLVTANNQADSVSVLLNGLAPINITRSRATGTILDDDPLSITIDIKPGSFPNSINLRSRGTVPVAIFSTATFDATTVDPLTVTLAGAVVKLKGNGTANASAQDVNGDGRLDLVVHVTTNALQLSDTDFEAVLEGRTFSGLPIRGTDSVRVVHGLLAPELGKGSNVNPLTSFLVAPIFREALNRWEILGLGTSVLDNIELRIEDLPDAFLGQAGDAVILIDANAAGHGWFIDATPWEDSEFTTAGEQGEQRRIDLLSVLAHEIGHLLGFEHGDDHEVMGETLATGVRRLPAVTAHTVEAIVADVVFGEKGASLLADPFVNDFVFGLSWLEQQLRVGKKSTSPYWFLWG